MVAAAYPSSRQVEAEVPDPELGRPGDATPPREGAQPGQELVEGERLDQVVVGAGLESGDPVGHGTQRGQHQHRSPVVDAADAAAHLEAVDVREHHVEHQDVVRVLGRHPDAVGAGCGDVRGDLLLAQAVLQEPGQLGLVLDEKDPHGSSVLHRMSR